MFPTTLTCLHSASSLMSLSGHMSNHIEAPRDGQITRRIVYELESLKAALGAWKPHSSPFYAVTQQSDVYTLRYLGGFCLGQVWKFRFPYPEIGRTDYAIDHARDFENGFSRGIAMFFEGDGLVRCRL